MSARSTHLAGPHRGTGLKGGWLRWRVVVPGNQDKLGISKTGFAAPSWHTFDQRVWRREQDPGWREIILTNLHERAPGRGSTYRVTVRGDDGNYLTMIGHSWQLMVREAKQWSGYEARAAFMARLGGLGVVVAYADGVNADLPLDGPVGAPHGGSEREPELKPETKTMTL